MPKSYILVRGKWGEGHSGGATIVSPTSAFTANTSVVVNGLTVGFATLTATVTSPDGVSPIPVGSTSIQVVPTTATPVNFRILSETNLTTGSTQTIGALFFQYSWSSSTGKQSDLSACTVGESVFYQNYPAPSFTWPPPMVTTQPTPNPTTISGTATNAGFQDTNFAPDSYSQPYSSAGFAATQRFFWSCTNYNNGSTQTLSPDVSIVRSIFKDTDGFWKYQISKSGYVNKIKLPNQ